MSEVKGQQEPSMEEILASIRRIIAEDNDAPATASAHDDLPPTPPQHHEEEEDVLDLTEILGEPTPPPPAPVMARETAPVRMLEPEPMTEQTRPSTGRLISDSAAASSSAAFASLARRKTASSELPIGNGALTLEQMVRDLVSPMLRDWLDSNLPPLVERLVKEEVQRLARDGL